MTNSYVSLYIHVVFSTKGRQSMITPELQTRLWAYMGGIARDNQMKALSIGGTEDHVHILYPFPPHSLLQKPFNLLRAGRQNGSMILL